MGLISDNVKYQLKNYLDDPTLTDDILITKTNEAASLEGERQQKISKNNKELKIRKLRTEVQPTQEASGAVGGREQTPSASFKGLKTQPPASSKETELYAMIKELKREMEEIRETVQEAP